MHTSPGCQAKIEENLPLKPVEFFVLAVLTDKERHGYGIVKEITARTNGRVRVRPGNLYRVLDRLMERGLVEAAGKKKTDPTTGTRRYYGVTALGREVAVAHIELFEDVAGASRKLEPRRG
jgi:DNA-binding PadR family transcriptional regulator